ncbi:hypothetical protein PFISCL1PPCAC_12137, partial [Pristionchus fissidentatus]
RQMVNVADINGRSRAQLLPKLKTLRKTTESSIKQRYAKWSNDRQLLRRCSGTEWHGTQPRKMKRDLW